MIAPSPKKKRVLTEHQKDIMRSRRSGKQPELTFLVFPVSCLNRKERTFHEQCHL